jgi:hypothetical protein
MRTETAANRRAFINEVAFGSFCVTVAEDKSELVSLKVDDAIARVTPRVREAAARGGRDGDYHGELSPIEIQDVKEQVQRLRLRLGVPEKAGAIVCNPRFPGCGMVDECEGDLLVSDALFEIKAGDRLFRAIDLRQVLTYLALNHAGGAFALRAVGLVNPRVGISFEMSRDEFCFEVSGRHSTQLLDAIVHGIASGDVSR